MFQELLEKLAQALTSNKIPYMLIGGQAVLLYGEPRLTRDIDITLGIGPEKLSSLLSIMKQLQLKPLVQEPQRFIEETMVLPCQDIKTGIRVDFVFSFSAYEEQALKRVRKAAIGKTMVCFASVEDLIIHKIIASRPRDLEDVKSILLKNPQIDEAYILAWLKQFDESLSQNCSARFLEIRQGLKNK